MTLECAFFGFLASDAEVRRTSQAGKQWALLRVGVGKGDDIQWVSVAVFGKAAQTAAELKKGDRCYCEGSIKFDAWRGNDSVERHGAGGDVVQDRQDPHQIDRNKPKRERQKREKPPASGHERADRSEYRPSGGGAGLNDDIPFSPEVR
jgi:single-stranded DNA-binding protein